MGTGKTHLACALVRECAPRAVLYASVSDLIRRLRETWRPNAECSERSLLTSLAEADLLVADEIGVQHGTDAERLHIFEVMDARYRAMRPTVLLSNEPLREVREYVGERVFDRLRETSRVVTFNWESARRGSQS